jgi:hypothetical protein
MLHANPQSRWTVQQVLNCPWMLKAVSSHGDIFSMMTERKRKCDEQAAADRAERQATKLAEGRGGKKQYRGADDEEEEAYDDEESLDKMKKLKALPADLVQKRAGHHVLYTTVHPLALAAQMETICDENGNTFSCEQAEGKDFKYNLKVTITRDAMPEIDDEEINEILGEDESNSDSEIQISMEVMKHPTEEKVYVLSFRQNGEQWAEATEYNKAFSNVVEMCGDIADEE